MKRCLKALFSGSVQGVGFRYTTRHLAGRYPVTGYVRNEADGKVALFAEGEEKVLKELLSAIQSSSLGGYIRDTRVEWLPCEDRFNDFQIAF